MSAHKVDHAATFYFALPRLVAMLKGTSSARGATSALEANVVGGFVFGITYLFVWLILHPHPPVWRLAVTAVATALITWMFWLAVCYLNAVVIRIWRALGTLRETRTDRVQSLFVCAETTVFATIVWHCGGWPASVAALWWIGVALNLGSALALRLSDGSTGNAR
ncbi:MAG: hypothetical protein M3Z64_06510 [Verrucomicrobiota bacterium]|nr:hypothetical protein [Verrucomicrobiota bacterium]